MSAFVQRELDVLAYWRDHQIFNKVLATTQAYPRFNFYEGPPFASGSPHLGHLITKAIKDSVIRYHSQNGRYVPRVAGWDTHGLPLESKAQNTLNLATRQQIVDFGIEPFNRACREIVMTARSDWEKTTERFGQWIDFDHDYKTMDLPYMECVWDVFKRLFDQGRVYRGIKVMPYSTGCSTVWSNFEAKLNERDVSDPALTVKISLTPSVDLPVGTHVLVFTTTPWTLPSNLALAVNPDLEYVLVRVDHEYLIMTKMALSRYFPESPPILRAFHGSDLVGRSYEPLFLYYRHFSDQAFKILPATFVTSEQGSGLVHLAPGFGAEDYATCLAAGLIRKDMLPPCPIDDLGRFTAEIPDYAGVYVKDADKKIVAELKKRNRVFQMAYEKHTYPYCWRTDTPLLYRASPCWFLDVTSVRDKLIANNRKITWVPKFVGENRFGNWLETVVDWCVSRNRFWGTPLPIWTDPTFTELVCLGSVHELETRGYWSDGRKVQPGDITDLHRHVIDVIQIPSTRQPGTFLHRVDEVLDCWFESGAMPYASQNYRGMSAEDFGKLFPADFISESLDQVRGWFYSLNVLSTMLYDQPAFKTCVVSGLVLAEDGTKMSKSKGNYAPPEEIMDRHGGDAVRLYLLNSPVVAAEPIRFKAADVEKIVSQVHVFVYNSVKFLLTMIEFYERTTGSKFVASMDQSPVRMIDQWLLQMTNEYVQSIHRAMAEYNLQAIYPLINQFVRRLSADYLKLNRSSMKAYPNQSRVDLVASSLNTLYQALYHFVVTTAPFAPMLCEDLFLQIRPLCPEHATVESVHLIQMVPYLPTVESTLLKPFEYLSQVLSMVRHIRGTHGIPTRRPLNSVIVLCPSTRVVQDLQTVESFIREELNLVQLQFETNVSRYLMVSLSLNLKSAGKKFGKNLTQVRAALAQVTPSDIKHLQTTGKLTLGSYELTTDDVVMTPALDPAWSKWFFETDGGLSVLVDPTTNPEVERLFAGKELNRTIQDLRKDVGLSIMDQIRVFVETTDSVYLDVVAQQDKYLTPYLNQPVETYTGEECFVDREFDLVRVRFSRCP
jgi:isoleucyl-tRNA synthetase